MHLLWFNRREDDEDDSDEDTSEEEDDDQEKCDAQTAEITEDSDEEAS